MDDGDNDADADADPDDEDIFGGADDNQRKVRGLARAPKMKQLVDENLDEEASLNNRSKLYKAVYDSFIKLGPISTSIDVDQTDASVEEICTSLLTEEKEITLVKLGKANMVS